MTAPLADQILDALGDPTIRTVARLLLTAPATQSDLSSELGCNQSTVSRATALLRSLGVADAVVNGRTTTFTAPHHDELVAILLAADRLAEAIIQRAADSQAELSSETRRLAVRAAPGEPAAETDA